MAKKESIEEICMKLFNRGYMANDAEIMKFMDYVIKNSQGVTYKGRKSISKYIKKKGPGSE